MKRLSALVVGATGLVGGECVRQLVDSVGYGRVIVLARRDLDPPLKHAKLQVVRTDFADLARLGDALRVDHVFCALGTTIRKAGSQDRFRQVDQVLPLQIAQLALANGARHYSLVSALGADPKSRVFYSRVKGEVEASLRAMGWPSLCLVRPSVIAGDRRESRPMERIAEHVLRFAPPRWRAVPASDIAGAMIQTALREPKGVTVIESRDIPRAARSAA